MQYMRPNIYEESTIFLPRVYFFPYLYELSHPFDKLSYPPLIPLPSIQRPSLPSPPHLPCPLWAHFCAQIRSELHLPTKSGVRARGVRYLTFKERRTSSPFCHFVSFPPVARELLIED